MTIRQFPILKWTLGVIFGTGFLAVTLSFLSAVWSKPTDFFGSPESGLWDRVLSGIVFLMLIAFGSAMNIYFASLIGTPVITSVIDGDEKTVTIARRGLFSRRTQRYLFSQVKDFKIEVIPGEKNSNYLALRLVNDELIRIDGVPGRDAKPLIDRLNAFLRKVGRGK